jgi:hypothetical protein
MRERESLGDQEFAVFHTVLADQLRKGIDAPNAMQSAMAAVHEMRHFAREGIHAVLANRGKAQSDDEPMKAPNPQQCVPTELIDG